ncbi:MAG: dolichyl-phosphate beta-glucosyltransferase, partial [Longimicrobiales bacterium]
VSRTRMRAVPTRCIMPSGFGPQPRMSIVIPAYNEESRIERTLREITFYCRGRREPFEVIVVDDGSRDGTVERVRSLTRELREIRLIRVPQRFGKGFAVRTGVLNARGGNVLFADADGATPIADVARLEEMILAGADIAIGSRSMRSGEVRVDGRTHRRIMDRVFHALVSIVAVRGFQDTQCGFKLMRADVARDLFSRTRIDGFSFDVELLLMAVHRGYRVREVAVNWTHRPGSRFNPVVDSLRMVADVFLIRSHAMRGYHDQPVMELTEAGSRAQSLPQS